MGFPLLLPARAAQAHASRRPQAAKSPMYWGACAFHKEYLSPSVRESVNFARRKSIPRFARQNSGVPEQNLCLLRQMCAESMGFA